MVKDTLGNDIDLQALANGPFLGRSSKPKGGPRGYAAPPGTGPQGETCGTCQHIVRKMMGKTYLKCGANRANWTGGIASDIRARSPACRLWEKKNEANS